jgi:hypothetical protein
MADCFGMADYRMVTFVIDPCPNDKDFSDLQREDCIAI